MLLDDNEQQQSPDSFHDTAVNLTSATIPRDEYSEVMANMTKTLHLNTPEQTMTGVYMDDFDDNSTNKLPNKKHLIGKLQARLIHNQIQRTQVRDYPRILRQSNTPAYWYKTPLIPRSVYFYDPSYQKIVQQRSVSPHRTNPKIRSLPSQPLRTQERLISHSNTDQYNSFPFTPRTKYMLDLYNTAATYHQQKQRVNQNYHPTTPNVSQEPSSIPSRLQSIPTLPRIQTSKQRNEQEDDLSNANEKQISNHQPIMTESRTTFNEMVMPPI